MLVNVPFLGDVLRAFPDLGLVAADRSTRRGHGACCWDCWRDSFLHSLAYRARITEALRQV